METKARYALIGSFTLAVIVATFAFVYWLHRTGGLGERSVYRIRFESSVSGLLEGSNVLFNGIRVGEVTGLQIDSQDPRNVMVTVEVDPSTPIRADTIAGMDFQGLTGAPAIALSGGSPTAPRLAPAKGEAPLLMAAPGAGESLTQSARETLIRLDKILDDNAAPLHDAITGISTFSQALARNSDRIDGILAGIERFTGGAAGKPRTQTFDLKAVRDFPACPRAPAGQLVISEPTTLMAFNTDKIQLAEPAPDPSVFDNARLTDNMPALVQAKLIESFESSGCFQSVTRPIDELEADYQLLVEVRSFRIVPTPAPIAEIHISAKLLAGKGKIIASRVFRDTAALTAVEPAAAVTAIDDAFGKVTRALVAWTISQTGKPHAEPKRAP